MTIVSGILVSHGITEYSPLGAYVRLIPMNFYAVFALLMVFVVAWFRIDIGSMRRHEIEATQGYGFDTKSDDDSASHDELNIVESDSGHMLDLLLPILSLIIATVAAMMYTGAQALSGSGITFTMLGAFENTDVGVSLIYGASVGLIVALATVFNKR